MASYWIVGQAMKDQLTLFTEPEQTSIDFADYVYSETWQMSVLAKLRAENLTLESDWNLIDRALDNVVCPNKCKAVARFLKYGK